MSLTFQGIPAAGGVALGDFLLYNLAPPHIPLHTVVPEAVTKERERLLRAVATSVRELNQLRDQAQARLGKEGLAILDAHLLLLQDEVLLAGAYQRIEEELQNAESALWQATDEFAQALAEPGDAYAQAGPVDMHDVRVRVISHLQGKPARRLGQLSKPVIIIAHDLLPSDTAGLDPAYLLGLVTEQGGPTSHTALLARQVGIPAVVGVAGILSALRSMPSAPQYAALDGGAGSVEIDPPPERIARYKAALSSYREHQQQLQAFRSKPAVTLDGKGIEVAANIGRTQDATLALEAGADGVGLFRTEGLFLDRDAPPGEEEQVATYRSVLEVFAGKRVVVRTLDIGGDKSVPYLALPHEDNPFLGLRGIRLCLSSAHLPLFRTQLRALLRAAEVNTTPLWIMLPMVSDLQELRRTKALLAEAEAALLQEGKLRAPARQSVSLGIMVETPAAALLADVFAREADFFSIGTNDLTQYTLASDRMNASIAGPHRPFHPALMRSVAHIVTTARARQRWVGVCGEIASNPRATTFLVGLGVNELSMEPGALNTIKQAICGISSQRAVERVKLVLEAETAEEVEDVLEQRCM